jgi:hypothetical protein
VPFKFGLPLAYFFVLDGGIPLRFQIGKSGLYRLGKQGALEGLWIFLGYSEIKKPIWRNEIAS